jgi:cold-inducible RNA-binding protein
MVLTCGNIQELSWTTSSKQTPTNGVEDNHRMSFTVFLGNLPAWVTADDIKGWLTAENLVADAIKVIRNPETQESKGFAFIDAPNAEEMNSIIRRFDRAPLEDRLLRANPAQPPKPKGQGPGSSGGSGGPGGRPNAGPMSSGGPQGQGAFGDRPPRRARKPATSGPRRQAMADGPQSAFAEELAKAL